MYKPVFTTRSLAVLQKAHGHLPKSVGGLGLERSRHHPLDLRPDSDVGCHRRGRRADAGTRTRNGDDTTYQITYQDLLEV